MNQRESFEAWAKSRHLDTTHKEKNGWGIEEYSPHIESMWMAWQAAIAQKEAQQAENESLRVSNDNLQQELDAAMTRLIECRSSVKFDLQEYGRFLDRKGAAVNDCDTDEYKRIEALLAAIDAIVTG